MIAWARTSNPPARYVRRAPGECDQLGEALRHRDRSVDGCSSCCLQLRMPGGKIESRISGLVAEYIVAIDVTRARFPAACSGAGAQAAGPNTGAAALAATCSGCPIMNCSNCVCELWPQKSKFPQCGVGTLSLQRQMLDTEGIVISTCGLVAMTSASHAEGRQLDPGQV